MNEQALDLDYYREQYSELLRHRAEVTDFATAVVINGETCDEVPVGASKMGGLPDLPEGIDYPECEQYLDEQDKYHKAQKLPLICQFDLAELAEFDLLDDLPKSGMLYIFWDGGDPGYFKKKYGIHTLRAYYYRGDRSTLTRREADPRTEIRPEQKVSFSEQEERFDMNEGDWEALVENLCEELKSDCQKRGIDYEELEIYKQIDDLYQMKDESCIYSGDKLSGFRAGLVQDGDISWNGFLQLDEHTGSLWYAYIDLRFSTVNGKQYPDPNTIDWQDWNEIGAGVDYDAD